MPDVIDINNKNYTLGFDDKDREIVECIEGHMGHEFAMYVKEYIDELIAKSDDNYWHSRTDEQAYEEELNQMCGRLDELLDCLGKIKAIGDNKTRKPEWYKLAVEAIKLIKNYR